MHLNDVSHVTSLLHRSAARNSVHEMFSRGDEKLTNDGIDSPVAVQSGDGPEGDRMQDGQEEAVEHAPGADHGPGTSSKDQ